MRTIACNINMGMKLQQIFINDPEKKDGKKEVQTFWMPFSEIAEFIAKQDGEVEVTLRGPKNFVEKIEKDTGAKEMVMYSRKRSTFKYL